MIFPTLSVREFVGISTKSGSGIPDRSYLPSIWCTQYESECLNCLPASSAWLWADFPLSRKSLYCSSGGYHAEDIEDSVTFSCCLVLPDTVSTFPAPQIGVCTQPAGFV